jgi:hypothetical protein
LSLGHVTETPDNNALTGGQAAGQSPLVWDSGFIALLGVCRTEGSVISPHALPVVGEYTFKERWRKERRWFWLAESAVRVEK